MRNFIRALVIVGLAILGVISYSVWRPGYTNKPKDSQVAFLAAQAEIRPLQEQIETNIKRTGTLQGVGVGVPLIQRSRAGSPIAWMAVMTDGEIMAKITGPIREDGSMSGAYILFVPTFLPNKVPKWRCITFPEGAVPGACKD
jgi:hypothetical protein